MSKAPPGGATIKDAQRSELNLFCRLEAELRCQAHNSWVSSSSSIGRPPLSPSPPVPHSSVITSARSGAVRGARLVARPPLAGVALVPAPAVLLLPAALLRAPLVLRLAALFRPAALRDVAVREVLLRDPADAPRALFRDPPAVFLRAPPAF